MKPWHTKPADQEGFTLIELIVVLVLMGTVSVFAGLFAVKTVTSYTFGKNNTEMALKTQIALERITLEMKAVNSVTSLTPDSRLDYTCNTSQSPGLDGTRSLKFISGSIYLEKNGTDHLLLEEISTPSLALLSLSDYNEDGSSDIQYVELGFDKRVNNTDRNFLLRIRPRNLVNHP